jgi:hypothetical protein
MPFTIGQLQSLLLLVDEVPDLWLSSHGERLVYGGVIDWLVAAQLFDGGRVL